MKTTITISLRTWQDLKALMKRPSDNFDKIIRILLKDREIQNGNNN